MRIGNHFTTFVNATNTESCLSMPTFYIGFCHNQLHQYGSYQPCKAGLFKVESEFLLNLDILLKKKLVLYQPRLRKKINFGEQLEIGRVGGFPCLFSNRQKVL